jgi:hypothetical protein
LTFIQACPLKSNQVVLTLPSDFGNKKRVTVLFDYFIDDRNLEIALLKDAINDILFLADVKEIQLDFLFIGLGRPYMKKMDYFRANVSKIPDFSL